MKNGFRFSIVTILFLAAIGCSVGKKVEMVKAEGSSIWITDLDEGIKQAKESGKYLLVDFSGSDWCIWCMRLDQEVFSQPEFKEFARDHLVTVLIDFPRNNTQSGEQQAKNERWMEAFGVQGFPTLILMTPQGEPFGKTGYQAGGAQKYVEHLKGMIAADPKKKP